MEVREGRVAWLSGKMLDGEVVCLGFQFGLVSRLCKGAGLTA